MTVNTQKILMNTGDIVEYCIAYDSPPDSIVANVTLDDNVIQKILNLLKENNIVEFRANCQLE